MPRATSPVYNVRTARCAAFLRQLITPRGKIGQPRLRAHDGALLSSLLARGVSSDDGETRNTHIGQHLHSLADTESPQEARAPLQMSSREVYLEIFRASDRTVWSRHRYDMPSRSHIVRSMRVHRPFNPTFPHVSQVYFVFVFVFVFSIAQHDQSQKITSAKSAHN